LFIFIESFAFSKNSASTARYFRFLLRERNARYSTNETQYFSSPVCKVQHLRRGKYSRFYPKQLALAVDIYGNMLAISDKAADLCRNRKIIVII
jgi:hypothetical protein